MKVYSSLKHAKKRSSNVCVAKRGKKIVVYDKSNPRIKSRQGKK
ncbi:50S ribosomal protein L36 [Anaplasmataceae bacterium AB001_6]|nr:50S ribosomal protein L36 [Anaplasmataceae bacterium AB001_6]